MKIKYLRSYRKKDSGRLVFVNNVTGTEAQLKAYKTAQGENYVEDEKGNALFFTTRFAGNAGNLIMTSEGKAIVDMSAFDQLASLVEQYPALANAIASQGVAGLLGKTAPVVEASVQKEKLDS